MTFSDAIPVQFWLIDCDTFNESEPYGINHKCFCAPWECDDEIKIQFQDTAAQNFVLLIYDDEDSLLDSIPIDETEDGVYLTSFTPSDNTPDFCDKKIQLQIRKEAGSQGVTLPALNTFANDGGAGTAWSLGSTPSVTRASIGSSEILFADFAFIDGVSYTLEMDFTALGSATCQLFLQIYDASFVSHFSTFDSFSGAETASSSLTFTATTSTTKIGITASWLSNNSETITITDIDATRTVGQAELIAKSDCLDVKSEHEGTLLITYSNFRNYAGIINNNGSP